MQVLGGLEGAIVPSNFVYNIDELIGLGSTATIHKATTFEGADCCAKISILPGSPFFTLGHEYDIMRYLQLFKRTSDKFVYAHYCDKVSARTIMIMDLMGPSLDIMLKKPLSNKCLAMIAIQLLHRIESMHRLGVCHGDIQPGNIVCGKDDDKKTLYLIDFASSGFYVNFVPPRYIQHIPNSPSCQRAGATMFTSARRHNSLVLCRKDDLESLAFTLAYLGRKTLPWMGETRLGVLVIFKETMTRQEIFGDLHPVFYRFLSVVRRMSFCTTPDFTELRKMFYEMLAQNKEKLDNEFDWLDPGW